MTKQKAFQKFLAELYCHTFNMLRRERNEHVCLILFCRSGRHRSVAVSYCLQYCMTLAGLESIGIHHASEGYYWRGTCGGCEDCKEETEQAKGKQGKHIFIVQRPLIRSENLNSAKPWNRSRPYPWQISKHSIRC